MPSFFFRELHLIKTLLSICDFCMSWSTRFASLKLWVGFSIFDSVLFLLKFMFLFYKMHGLFDFKIPFKIKIIKKPHTVLLSDLWFFNCNKVLKFSDICESWSSPKTDQETNSLNLANQKLRTSVFLIVTFE